MNEKQRKQEREDNEKQRLDIENTRRKAKGMELLTELKSDEKKSDEKDKKAKDDTTKNESTKNLSAKDADSKDVKEEDEAKEPDALLLEAGKILTDLMSLSQNPTAEQQQAQQQTEQ